MGYNFTAIEKKWQQYWLDHKSFAALDPKDAGDMPKAFVLDMFPYPSGQGLHVGHPEGYTATDIYSRHLRMKGYNVLHPMGWDAFGLPAEQYAIKTNTHPRVTTEQNIANFRRQIQMLGLSYDWDREVNTTDEHYYRWTQWIFLQLFNSYFDPIEKKARPIKHLINELINENFVIGPDGSITLNETQEGMEAITGELRVERLWKELAPLEQQEVIAGQRLAYTDEVAVNWCPQLGTVLSNEEVIDGRSEVGGFPVEKRPLRQWVLRITAFADRLIDDLDTLQWPESLKEMQRNWIGKSTGAEVDFDIAPPTGAQATSARVVVSTSDIAASSDDAAQGKAADGEAADDADMTLTVFTTRPDTLYGVTFMVLAPEHPLVDKITTNECRAAVEEYRKLAGSRSDRDRLADSKDKTGVFTGGYAINPVNFEKVPVFIADYVMMGYGTGAIMAVPAHDDRDYAFAIKYDLPVIQVVRPVSGEVKPGECFAGEGIAINSLVINDMPTAQAKEKIIEVLRRDGVATKTVKYKLRDWLFSRQRYWGEPFPIVLDEQDYAYAIDETELPLKLPAMEDFKPTGTPEPPLSKVTDWVNVSFGGKAMKRETNTMPQWAGSCWYYLRYIDPHNSERFVDPAKEKYWMPVDLYVGGVEHAVLHLLYARFWHKVLFDLGHVSSPEPFAKLVNQGMILGEMEYHFFEDASGQPVSASDLKEIADEVTPSGLTLAGVHKQTGQKIFGKSIIEPLVERKGDSFVLKANPAIKVDARSFKMSKSRGNVVNPDNIVADYGADCFRLYEMYMGPLEAQKPWNTRDIIGMMRFLNAVWRNVAGDEESNTPANIVDTPAPEALDRQMHRTIRKVADDILALRFNTAIAELVKLNNELTRLESTPRSVAENLVLMLAPFAPHIAEELWQRLGHENSLARQAWPDYDPAKLVESVLELPVQVNGKLRDKITVPADADQDTILTAALAAPKVGPWVEGKQLVKKLYVPGKLVNLVVK